MIISHKLKVIYIRLQKTASTSFEMALSKYCGPDDMISKLGRGYDKTRKSLGYPTVKSGSWWQHAPAHKIKSNVSADIWNNYTKIATMRNPYERMVSRYYARRGIGQIPETQNFEEFIKMMKMSKNGIAGFLYNLIHIEGKSVLDFCIRYEHMAEDVKRLETIINCPGLWETMQNFSLNNQFRPDKKTAYEMYSKYPQAKLIIDEDLYQNLDKYELLREHWPMYKSELEKTLATGDKKK